MILGSNSINRAASASNFRAKGARHSSVAELNLKRAAFLRLGKKSRSSHFRGIMKFTNTSRSSDSTEPLCAVAGSCAIGATNRGAPLEGR